MKDAMEKDTPTDGALGHRQLKKFAQDFSAVYRSEKHKRVELEAANAQLKRYADDLHHTVSELRAANRDLRNAYYDTISRLVRAAEYKDEDTGDHIVRMSRYSALIAEKLGLSSTEVHNIHYAAPMHDVGKIGIPDSILLKPGKLTREEFEVIKTHTQIGARILSKSKARILRLAQQIAISHHEKWDGTGYPQGLSGKRIPLAGRIVAISDTFDALTSKRPYKDPYPVEVALGIIKQGREKQFDPAVTDVFFSHIGDILAIKKEVGSDPAPTADFKWSQRDMENF